MSIAEQIAQAERRIRIGKEFQKSAIEDLDEIHESMKEGYEPEEGEYNATVHAIHGYALRIMEDEELIRELLKKEKEQKDEEHRRKVDAFYEAEHQKWAELNRFLSKPEPFYYSDDE